MKKRILTAAVFMSAMLVFAGCSDKKTVSEGENTEASAEEKDTDEEANDSAAQETGKTVLVKLGEYKGVEVPAMDLEVTEEEIQNEINYALSDYAELQEVEGRTVVEEGDTVNIDYRGLIDGKEFEGGTSSEGGFDLTIGSGQFIDGFEDQLIGKELGGFYELDLKFPDGYRNTEVAGKPVVFEVTVNKIQEQVLPELTDAFVQENLEFDSVDAYRENLKSELEALKLENAKSQKEYDTLKAIIDNSEFETAQDEVDAMKQNMIATYESYASAYGMDMESFLSVFMNGMTLEKFEAECESSAEFRIKSALVVDAVTEAEGLTVSEEEYTQEAEEIMGDYGYDSLEDFEGQYTKDAIMENVIYNKTIDYLVEQAVEG